MLDLTSIHRAGSVVLIQLSEKKILTSKEIMETKANNMEVPGFDTEELEEMLNHICTE